MSIFDMGIVTYTLVLLVITGKLMLEMHSYTLYSVICIIISFVLWFGWLFGSNLWYEALPEIYMSIYHLCGTTSFYTGLLACSVTSLIRDFAWKYAKRVSTSNT